MGRKIQRQMRRTRMRNAGRSRRAAVPRRDMRRNAASFKTSWQRSLGNQALQSHGQPLDAASRAYFEPRFAANFSQVRVHHDDCAQQLNKTLNARAFTVGEHIAFARGQYAPQHQTGKHLLAHELAHTLQQRKSGRRIQRQPANPPKERVFSEKEKRDIRKRLRAQATHSLSELFRTTLNRRLTRSEGKKRIRYMRMVDAAIARVNRSKKLNVENSKARFANLMAFKKLLSNDRWALVALHFNLDQLNNWQRRFRVRGDIKRNYSDEDLQLLRNETSEFSMGPEAHMVYLFENAILKKAGITRKQISIEGESDVLSEKETKRISVEQRIQQDLAQADVAVTQEERQALVDALAKLSEEQRKAFLAWLKSLRSKGEEEATQPLEALKRYLKMTPTQREIIVTRTELDEGKTAAEATKAEKKVISISTEQMRTSKEVKGKLSDVDRLLATIEAKTSEGKKARQGLFELSKILSPFLNEMYMFKGMLAGAADQSPQHVGKIAKAMTAELDGAIQRLLERVRRMAMRSALESAALLALTKASVGLSAGAWAIRAKQWYNRIQAVRDMIHKYQQIYATVTRIEGVLKKIDKAHTKFQKSRARFDAMRQRLESLVIRLESIESSEKLEAELERLETTLMETMQSQLDSGLAPLMEVLYLPDAMGNEELMQLLMNMPRGIDALQDMYSYYQVNKSKSGDEQVTGVLAAKAFRAGGLMYPAVGFLAGLATEELKKAFPSRTIKQELQLVLTRIGGKTGRGKRIGKRSRGLFARLSRKRYEYDVGVLKKRAEQGAQWLAKKIQQDEPGGHWVRPWFRFTVRKHLKDLRRHARNDRKFWVRARPKSRRAKKAGTGWETVPPPKFRLRRFRAKGGKLIVNVALNPSAPLSVDQLDYKDFGVGDGIAYRSTTAKRRKALEVWLRKRRYDIVQDNKGSKHIRLVGGRVKPVGGKKHQYLRFDGGRIKQGINAEAYQGFLNRPVTADEDLPEGYHLLTYRIGKKIAVATKRGAKGKFPALIDLGLNEKRELVVGKQKPIPASIAPPGITEAKSQHYHYQSSLEKMFDAQGRSRSEYNNQGKSRKKWRSLFSANRKLRERPVAAEGKLGYMIHARGLSDLLGSRHIPELMHGDDKGHIIAKRFHGTDNYQNLIPMKGSVNRWPGKWYKMEHAIGKVFVGKNANPKPDVQIKIDIHYASIGSRRPSRFVASWQDKNDPTRKGSLDVSN